MWKSCAFNFKFLILFYSNFFFNFIPIFSRCFSLLVTTVRQPNNYDDKLFLKELGAYYRWHFDLNFDKNFEFQIWMKTAVFQVTFRVKDLIIFFSH